MCDGSVNLASDTNDKTYAPCIWMESIKKSIRPNVRQGIGTLDGIAKFTLCTKITWMILKLKTSMGGSYYNGWKDPQKGS